LQIWSEKKLKIIIP